MSDVRFSPDKEQKNLRVHCREKHNCNTDGTAVDDDVEVGNDGRMRPHMTRMVESGLVVARNSDYQSLSPNT